MGGVTSCSHLMNTLCEIELVQGVPSGGCEKLVGMEKQGAWEYNPMKSHSGHSTWGCIPRDFVKSLRSSLMGFPPHAGCIPRGREGQLYRAVQSSTQEQMLGNLAEMWIGSEQGSYLRLIHCCITQL